VFALRYSATNIVIPTTLFNRLTPYEAYRQGLVKRVEVAGVEKESNENQVYISFGRSEIRQENFHWPKLLVHALMKSGTVKNKSAR